ncbi:electron transport complex protein RnfG [Cricetibacter osteomyelitidis]|uniref:Ion-translocating oxidoreductase complex subunit G n=1 Tax=Cricetibacter osteomyelitidis TaxID=1521931 RepID=A0A4R2TD64_9PAST|nr:electron transport complex subunit RsxG [Cricetibacter osteomyelitidis]TCP95058.1 electron transport complex protein RnfG [Cricetibacter osteomyelitidis]
MKSITLKFALMLAGVALVCTAISSGVYFLTKAPIQQAIDNNQKALLAEVIPAQYADNDLLKTCVKPTALSTIEKLYIAKKNQQITAYAFETTAPDGYSGDIRLLVGLTPQGEVLGVRVIEHHETPGLGDKIETRISNWILSLSNQMITPDNLPEWAVKKDGGKFDQFAGATITPRAVVNQTKRSALAMLNRFKPAQINDFPRCN